MKCVESPHGSLLPFGENSAQSPDGLIMRDVGGLLLLLAGPDEPLQGGRIGVTLLLI